MSVLNIGLKSTLAASDEVPWWVTVSILTDGCQTVALRFLADAASVISSHYACAYVTQQQILSSNNADTSQSAVAWLSRPQGPPSGVWTGHRKPTTTTFTF